MYTFLTFLCKQFVDALFFVFPANFDSFIENVISASYLLFLTNPNGLRLILWKKIVFAFEFVCILLMLMLTFFSVWRRQE